MHKFSTPIAIVLTLLLLTGCSDSLQTVPDQFVSGLEIPEMSSSLGSLEGQPEKQVFSYTIVLVNTNIYEVQVQSIEPILVSELSDKVTTDELRTSVDQSIQPGEVLEISGQFSFDAEGLTKEQILEWEPFINTIRVESEAMLPLPVVDNN